MNNYLYQNKIDVRGMIKVKLEKHRYLSDQIEQTEKDCAYFLEYKQNHESRLASIMAAAAADRLLNLLNQQMTMERLI